MPDHFKNIYVHYASECEAIVTREDRILKPGGVAILLETLGTGRDTPEAPTSGMAEFYSMLEDDLGYTAMWISTDYYFESAAEAARLVRFFFGDDLADWIAREELTVLPEYTGIWWKQV